MRRNDRKRVRTYRRRHATARFAVVFTAVALMAIAIFFFLHAFPAEHILQEKQKSSPEGFQNCAAAVEKDDSYVVIVDAGHGGDDFGAMGISTGRKEKEVNLEIACAVRDLLETAGIRVVMTRETDDMIAPTKEEDMKKRESIIRNSGADLFVSIHQNFYDQGKEPRGPQVFYREEGAPGQELAQYIQQEMNKQLDVKRPRDIAAGDYQLLRPGNQPSVIVECGFFSNPEEEKLLQEKEYQKKVAKAIVDGILLYRERKESSPPQAV